MQKTSLEGRRLEIEEVHQLKIQGQEPRVIDTDKTRPAFTLPSVTKSKALAPSNKEKKKPRGWAWLAREFLAHIFFSAIRLTTTNTERSEGLAYLIYGSFISQNFHAPARRTWSSSSSSGAAFSGKLPGVVIKRMESIQCGCILRALGLPTRHGLVDRKRSETWFVSFFFFISFVFYTSTALLEMSPRLAQQDQGRPGESRRAPSSLS